MRPERDLVVGDRYVLVARIAVGAMGDVWEGTDTVLGRPVAVKILKEELRTASTFLARFRAEARLAAGLSHPGIAAVYDYRETPDLAFLVMELVPGQPLSELLAEQPDMPVTAKLSILGQTAEALGAAHDAGIVHRDVKPGNLIVRPDGTVKVTDFGIARARASASLTETGEMIGTATYVSPEQAVGGQATGASDIYSLGVVAYEMFAGHPPFERDTPLALALAHVNDPPPPLPDAVPRGVAELIESALAKDPARRPPSAASFAVRLRHEMAALEPAATGVPHRQPSSTTAAWPSPSGPAAAPPATAAAPAVVRRRRRRRRRLAVAVAAVVAVVGLLASGAIVWFATRPAATDDEAGSEPAAASTSTVSSAGAGTLPWSERGSRGQDLPPPVQPAAAGPAATEPPATEPPVTEPPATEPPATAPPVTGPPPTEPSPATPPPQSRPATPGVPVAAGNQVDGDEAVAFVVDYYDRLAAGDYATTWEALSPEFRAARDLTFERYVGYWRSTTLEVGDVTFAPGPGMDEGRVRFEARYTTATRVVDETDEITLRRQPDGRLLITHQRIV